MKTLSTVLHIATSVKCPIIALKKVITYGMHMEGLKETGRQQNSNSRATTLSVHVNYRLKGKGTTTQIQNRHSSDFLYENAHSNAVLSSNP